MAGWRDAVLDRMIGDGAWFSQLSWYRRWKLSFDRTHTLRYQRRCVRLYKEHTR